MDYTDVYFSKTRTIAEAAFPDVVATYGVFLRHEAIAALDPACIFLRTHADAKNIRIIRHYQEGDLVPPEHPLFSYEARMQDIVKLETRMLQRVGMACISAYNAYNQSMACPHVPFMDMAARHCAPDDGGVGMIDVCAYGASVGSRTAQAQGAKGFIGSSLDLTAPYYGGPGALGLGTMPHALIGLCGSTLEALARYVNEFPNETRYTALVDYFGRETSDSIMCANWFKEFKPNEGKTFGVRLDTHGGRFAEGLDYDKSVDIVCEYMLEKSKWSCVRKVMGNSAFDVADDSVRDRVAGVLFGTGVSVANIVNMRNRLDEAGHKDVFIVASSGFNVRKCRLMAQAAAPIDMIGTGSFLPETMNETYATADIYAYDGKFSVKVGRENVFREVAKQVLR